MPRVPANGIQIEVESFGNERDPAILLIGGDKTGDKRFYDRMIPLADDLYDDHLAELDRENANGR